MNMNMFAFVLPIVLRHVIGCRGDRVLTAHFSSVHIYSAAVKYSKRKMSVADARDFKAQQPHHRGDEHMEVDPEETASPKSWTVEGRSNRFVPTIENGQVVMRKDLAPKRSGITEMDISIAEKYFEIDEEEIYEHNIGRSNAFEMEDEYESCDSELEDFDEFVAGRLELDSLKDKDIDEIILKYRMRNGGDQNVASTSITTADYPSSGTSISSANATDRARILPSRESRALSPAGTHRQKSRRTTTENAGVLSECHILSRVGETLSTKSSDSEECSDVEESISLPKQLQALPQKEYHTAREMQQTNPAHTDDSSSPRHWAITEEDFALIIKKHEDTLNNIRSVNAIQPLTFNASLQDTTPMASAQHSTQKRFHSDEELRRRVIYQAQVSGERRSKDEDHKRMVEALDLQSQLLDIDDKLRYTKERLFELKLLLKIRKNHDAPDRDAWVDMHEWRELHREKKELLLCKEEVFVRQTNLRLEDRKSRFARELRKCREPEYSLKPNRASLKKDKH